MPMKKLTPWQKSQICLRYQAGETQYQLAEEFSVKQPTISYILKKNNIETRFGEPGYTRDTVLKKNIVYLYLRGSSQADIARRLDTSTSYVSKVVKTLNKKPDMDNSQRD